MVMATWMMRLADWLLVKREARRSQPTTRQGARAIGLSPGVLVNTSALSYGEAR